jgi:tRNA (guanine6-N2)-methyltransferase
MIYEAEILPGLKPFANSELRGRFRQSIDLFPDDTPDRLPFQYDGPAADLLDLRTVVAIYAVLAFDIPRPKALLGHQHFTRLIKGINRVIDAFPDGAFRTFRISAAGKESSVFSRLVDELQRSTGLIHSPDDADLFMRIRPAAIHQSGWEVLIRVSPRPLSTRQWRVCDHPGALNATIAAAVVDLTRSQSQDRFLNLMCGSGTLLIERQTRHPAAVAVGCDIDHDVLACAAGNISQSGLADLIATCQMDAASTGFPDRCFDVICADLPWGVLVGSHRSNADLYPAVIEEAARIAAAQARMVIITQEIRLFEEVIARYTKLWKLRQVVRVFQGGLHPRIYSFEHQ